MHLVGNILGYVIVIALIIGYIWASWWKIREWRLFKKDKYNPYRRKCCRCGQWQSMYDNGKDLSAYHSWWEEIYPMGNNPKCKCKKYARE